MKVGERIPTLGDCCDVQMVMTQRDPFAVLRLLARWLEPEPSLEDVRKLTVLEVSDLFQIIRATVMAQIEVMAADPGKQKH